MEPRDVRRVAVVGTGVIGSGWAAHFLRRGLDVVAYDTAPGAEESLRRSVEDAWPTMVRLGLSAGADPKRLSFASDLAGAVGDAQFIPANAPERLDLKIALLAEIDAAAPSDTVISTSTSGYSMTQLQQRCRHPERTVISHPFNPPYLIPLVEVAGGERTDPRVVEWTTAFWTAMGKRPLTVRRENPGFIANRLQEALWREALHMVNEGMASVEEIDAAITSGPGLRWAIMGPMLTFHLAGGPGGMARMLEHFDPGQFDDWSCLSAPPITEELKARIVEGCLQEAKGRSIRDLEETRDRSLVTIMEALTRAAS